MARRGLSTLREYIVLIQTKNYKLKVCFHNTDGLAHRTIFIPRFTTGVYPTQSQIK